MTEFRFEQCLGRGGFGEVYRGVMSRGGGVEVDVAIKVLRPDLDPESQGVQRLRDEGRLLGRLTHPAILRVYDLVVIEGRAALVSEYVPGDDLGRLLRTERLPPRAVFEIVAQVAAALDAAWSWPSVTDGKPLHLVHRDVKPDNIRVDPHGSVKLLDFGIAQAQTVHREAQTRVNTIMGSTHYLAPERLVQQEVGPESDVFALGCTLFEALAGEALFARKSMRQMYLLMVEERKFDEFVAERCDAFPGRLGGERAIALLRAMIAWRKQNRPTAAEVASRCDAISDSMDGQTLTQWCRARTWPPLPSARGPLEGFTFASAVAEQGAAGANAGHMVVKVAGDAAAGRDAELADGSPRPAQPDEQRAMERVPQESAPPGPRDDPAAQGAAQASPHKLVALERAAENGVTERGDLERPKVLGETSGQTLTDLLTSMKRGIAAHSPHPWAPAEMMAVIDSPFPVLYRIPQLLRQLPEPPPRPVSATEALTVQNSAPALMEAKPAAGEQASPSLLPTLEPPEPVPALDSLPPSEVGAAPEAMAPPIEAASAPASVPASAPGEATPSPAGETPEVADPTVPLDRAQAMVGQTLVPFMLSQELAPQEGATPSTGSPPSLSSPDTVQAAPVPPPVPDRPSPVDATPSALERPRLNEDAGETTAALLDEDTEVGEEVSTRAAPGARPPVSGSVIPESVAARPSEGEASGSAVPAEAPAGGAATGLPEELPTVRISRKREGGLQLSLPPEAAGAAANAAPPAPEPLRPVEDFASFDDEPPTVPASPDHIRASVAASSPPLPNGMTAGSLPSTSVPSANTPAATPLPAPSKRTPKAPEVRKRKALRSRDLRWVVTWGSSMAGLGVGLVFLFVLAVAVWLRAS